MRRAELIAQQLLEVFNYPFPGSTIAPRGAVYVLSGGTGRMYSSLAEYVRLDIEAQDPVPSSQVHQVIADKIAKGMILVHQPDYGSLVVYSKDLPVPASTAQIEAMHRGFSILNPKERIAWSKDLTIRPTAVTFEQVFGASKTVDQNIKQREKLEKQGEKADKEAARQAPEQAANATAAEHGSWFNPPGWEKEFKQAWPGGPDPTQAVGYSEKTPEPEQQNPYDIGITPGKMGRRRGVLVAQVHAGSPAHRSLLQPGDIIRQAGPFTSRSGEVIGPYRIDKASELVRVLSWLRGGTAFPLKVVRGSGYVEVVLMPVPRANWRKTA